MRIRNTPSSDKFTLDTHELTPESDDGAAVSNVDAPITDFSIACPDDRIAVCYEWDAGDRIGSTERGVRSTAAVGGVAVAERCTKSTTGAFR